MVRLAFIYLIHMTFVIYVTSECSCGFFGKNCTEKCSINCLNGSCDQVTGHCHQCVDGYSGDLCSKDGLSKEAIIGISCGCALFAVIVIIIIIVVICRKRNSSNSQTNWRNVNILKSCMQSNQTL